MSATELLTRIPGLGGLPEDLLEVLGWVGLALLVGTVVRLVGYAVGRRKRGPCSEASNRGGCWRSSSRWHSSPGARESSF